MRKISLSIVTPVYAGKDYLRELAAEVAKLKSSLEAEDAPLEILEMVLVDDASKDGSAQVLEELQKQHTWIRTLQLAHNFGQHPATIAGILHTSGDWVATLDEDLQHHPSFVPQLLAEAVLNECDIAYARPEEAVHDSVFRDWSSRFYKSLLVKITGIPFIKDFNSFRVIRGSVARATASVCSHETYFDVALTWFSDKIRSITLPLKDHRFIATKKSGYNLAKLLSHARRLIVSTQTKVLRLGFIIGALAIPMSLAAAALAIYRKFFDPTAHDVPGWASL
ncbi:glycosyltransferase, partial [bacterium]|nr:glycosyltransferase [bacterium]